MTHRQIVIDALLHKQTEVVPFSVGFTYQEYLKMVDYTKDQYFMQKYDDYMFCMQYWGYPTEMSDKKEYFLDDFGVVWNRTGVDKDIGVVDNPILIDGDMKKFKPPFFDEKRIRQDCEYMMKNKGDKFCVAGIGFTMFERFWSYIGMENALIYMITDKDFTNALLDEICQFDLKVLDIFNEYEFDGIYFGDDWGQQKGMIMGAPLWRELIKPRMKKLYDRAKKDGKFILQHSCGDIEDVFEDLIEIGLDCYQTFQPEIYDIKKIKNTIGDELSFWGGISTQAELPFKTPDEIRQIVRERISILGKNGGYIAGPTHAVPQDVPPENVIAMLDEFMHQ